MIGWSRGGQFARGQERLFTIKSCANRAGRKSHRGLRFSATLTIFVADQGTKVSQSIMTLSSDLDSLSSEDMKSLILALHARVAELEARLGKPPKQPPVRELPPVGWRE
jgi:hypothetical protein